MPEKFRYIIFITLVVLIALFIRITLLDSESLTGDELYSLEVAKDLFSSGIKTVGYHLAHPPLYYIILHPIVNYIGDDIFILRLLSLVSGIVIIISVILWTSQLTSKPYAGIYAGLLVALSSKQIYFSQEAESYSLYSLLIVLTAIFIYKAIEKPGIKYWMLYSLLLLLSFFTHYVSVLYFLIFGIYILSLRDFRNLRIWFVFSLPAITLLAAWFIYLWSSYTEAIGRVTQLSWIVKPEFSWLFYLFASFNGLPPVNKGAALTLIALIMLISLCIYRLIDGKVWNDNPKMIRSYIFVAATAFLPPVILFIVAYSPLSLNVWLEGHVFPSHAFLMIFITTSLWHLFKSNKRLLIASAIVFIGLQSLGSLGWIQGPQRHPYREIAQYATRISNNNVPVYTTYFRCPGRVCNYYLNDNEYVKKVPNNLSDLPRVFILIYRPAVIEDHNYFTNLIEAGWKEKESSHFGSKWGHTVVILDYTNNR